jgi:DNA-binding XRE family transcriptional regulator
MANRRTLRLANRIAEFRTTLRLSQARLAIFVGTSAQMVDRIEKGQAVSADLAVAIAETLGQSVESVFPDHELQFGFVREFT